MHVLPSSLFSKLVAFGYRNRNRNRSRRSEFSKQHIYHEAGNVIGGAPGLHSNPDIFRPHSKYLGHTLNSCSIVSITTDVQRELQNGDIYI
jgi:hypothetical protein